MPIYLSDPNQVVLSSLFSLTHRIVIVVERAERGDNSAIRLRPEGNFMMVCVAAQSSFNCDYFLCFEKDKNLFSDEVVSLSVWQVVFVILISNFGRRP